MMMWDARKKPVARGRAHTGSTGGDGSTPGKRTLTGHLRGAPSKNRGAAASAIAVGARSSTLRLDDIHDDATWEELLLTRDQLASSSAPSPDGAEHEHVSSEQDASPSPRNSREARRTYGDRDHRRSRNAPDRIAAIRHELDEAEDALDAIRGGLLSEARAAIEEREIDRARKSVAVVEQTMRRADRVLGDAATKLLDLRAASMALPALGAAIADLCAEALALHVNAIQVRGEVIAVLQSAPPQAESTSPEGSAVCVPGDDDPDAVIDDESALDAEWHAQLDARAANEAADEDVVEIRGERSQAHGVIANDALTGIQLYLYAKDALPRYASAGIGRDGSSFVGPGTAGPYELRPALNAANELQFYFAYHSKRRQNEWVVGPDAIDSFAALHAFYEAAAARLLPGSVNVAGSQQAGAETVRDPESVVRQQAFGRAPWQRANPGESVGVPVADLGATIGDADGGLDALNGGGGLLSFARNARLRIHEYVKPAQQLAAQLASDVETGKLSHMEARLEAVEGRNRLLERTRQRQSPSARYASRKVKEEGRSVEHMTEKKVRDNLRKYSVSPETRRVLDVDSELWAKYSSALEAGEDVLAAALRDLGGSPTVSRSIIQSAGHTNRTFTRLARWAGPGAVVAGALAAADMIVDIRNDLEAQNWHAAAGELAAFTGGTLGGEAGAIAMTWIASLLTSASGPLIVVSIIGATVGAGYGASAGMGVVDALSSGGAYGVGPATALAFAGGLGGAHSKDGIGLNTTTRKVEDAIVALDSELDEIATAVKAAQDRDQLEALQRMRLDVLGRRQQLESYLTALHVGAFKGREEPRVCEPPQPPDECSLDHDCDSEVD